jgi:Xaa-Pro aminopeptidase
MKLKEFQKTLAKEDIDLVFLSSPDPNIIYFTQNNFSHAMLIISPKKSNLLITKLDNKPKLSGIKVSYLKKDWDKTLENKNIKMVGINNSVLTLAYLNKLKKIFPKAKFKDISKTIEELRSKKTDQEVNNLSKACKITSEAFNKVVDKLSQGKLKTELDVANFLEKDIRNQGGSIAFPTIVAMGENAAIPHHVTSNQKLAKGFLLIDFGANFQNYCADMTRVVFLGNPTKSERTFYNLLLSSQQGAINQIKENLPFTDLDKHARKTLGKYSNNFIHSLGHGIGVEVHEAPVFSNENSQIAKNHVFTVEPGIYFPGKFGLRIEDTLVFNGKIKLLTIASKELQKINKIP